MKRTAVLLLVAIACGFIGCNNAVQEQRTGLEYFIEQPINISWNGDKNEGVQSFQAQVEVYSMNNRRDIGAGLEQTYRLAIKTIGERIVTRLDFENDGNTPFRSFLSDGNEIIVFDPDTDEIAHRIPNADSSSPLARLFGNENGLSRVNLSRIRNEAQRLSLDLQETSEEGRGKMLLELPPDIIPQNGLDKITRSRAKFDLANETLIETEVVMIREDETVVTTTVTPVYEDKDGTPVKIGMITVIDSKAPNLIEGIGDMPIFNSPDDVPTLSEEQFMEMQDNGNIHEIPDIVFGNPADLSFTETIYEVYRDIEINSAPENLFRLILE